MKTTLVGPSDWQASVIAVPPLARNPDLSFAVAPNRTLIRHLEAGGINILMCGGNANFYHVGMSEYEQIVDILAETVAPDSWVIPTIGPEFGNMADQCAILARKGFPTALVMPTYTNMTHAGLDRAIRMAADTLGKPLVLYLKSADYLDLDRIAALHRDGCLLFVKYAIVCDDPDNDPYMPDLIDALGIDAVVSGLGERPALAHFRTFGLRAYTTGSGTVAPAHTADMLRWLKAGDFEAAGRIRSDFLELETLRDKHGPAAVLHAAVTLSGVADLGPILPLLSDLPPEHVPAVRKAAAALLALNTRAVGVGPD